MDPYLERYWRDVHSRLVTYACDQIQERLPADLIARIEERLFVETPEGPARSIHADIGVMERGRGRSGAGILEGIAVADPEIVFTGEEEPFAERSIEIVEARSGHRVITAIEFQSPSNKIPGSGKDLYLRKVEEFRQARVSLVEIDLVRSGVRLLGGSPSTVNDPGRTAYAACIHRGWEQYKFEIYRFSLRERLPAIRIPLRESDSDIPLELQALVDLAYVRGRYGVEIDYSFPPDPPLDEKDAVWLGELVRSGSR
jgi:hypothetical protein